MTDLFVSQDGTDIRVCKRDEENLKQLREFLDGYGRPVGAPEPWRREIYGLWGDLSRAVRIAERQLAQAEKMKEALEAYAKPQRWLRAYQPTGELGLTRCVFTGAGHGFELAQEALAELKETNDEH